MCPDDIRVGLQFGEESMTHVNWTAPLNNFTEEFPLNYTYGESGDYFPVGITNNTLYRGEYPSLNCTFTINVVGKYNLYYTSSQAFLRDAVRVRIISCTRLRCEDTP